MLLELFIACNIRYVFLYFDSIKTIIIIIIIIRRRGCIFECSLTLNRGAQPRFPPKCIENTFQVIQSTFRSLKVHFKKAALEVLYLFGHPWAT